MLPLGEKERERIELWWPIKEWIGEPVVMHQRRICLSSEPVARVRLSGLHDNALMPAKWPVNVWTSWPVDASHIFAVESAETLAMYLPSGLYFAWATPRECAKKEYLSLYFKGRLVGWGDPVGLLSSSAGVGGVRDLDLESSGVPSSSCSSSSSSSSSSLCR